MTDYTLDELTKSIEGVGEFSVALRLYEDKREGTDQVLYVAILESDEFDDVGIALAEGMDKNAVLTTAAFMLSRISSETLIAVQGEEGMQRLIEATRGVTVEDVAAAVKILENTSTLNGAVTMAQAQRKPLVAE